MKNSGLVETTGLHLAPPPRVLMCQPEYFDVSYEINAFMKGNQGRVDFDRAKLQWLGLYNAVTDAGANIELMKAESRQPDLVFTANGGFICDQTVILPRFAHPERQGEEFYFKEWFRNAGFDAVEVPWGEFFEGEGDVVQFGDLLFLGCHSRTTEGAKKTLEEVTGLQVIPLRLNPDGFYHLDTCMFSDAGSGKLFFTPAGFTPDDVATIIDHAGSEHCVQVSLEEAQYFACNTVVINNVAISPLAPKSFAEKVEKVGLKSVMVDLSEFLKAGGAAKCLTLHLD